MTNNAVKAKLEDDEFFSYIPYGGTTRKPCEHRTTICIGCIESWSWDWTIYLTPGTVRTFIRRYGSFPFELIDDPGCHFHVLDKVVEMMEEHKKEVAS